MKRRIVHAAVGALLAFAAPYASAAVSVGTLATFEDGTTEGWGSGAPHPMPPAQVPGGGPAGVDDAYLRASSTGELFVAGGRFVVISGAQWSGDYVAAGVTGIRMDARNFGQTDLSLRLLFEAGPALAWSAEAVMLPAESGWMPLFFPVNGNALTGTLSALSDAQRIRIYHSMASFAPSGADALAAVAGFDNIGAVPEPGAWATMLAGLALLVPCVRRHTIRQGCPARAGR